MWELMFSACFIWTGKIWVVFSQRKMFVTWFEVKVLPLSSFLPLLPLNIFNIFWHFGQMATLTARTEAEATQHDAPRDLWLTPPTVTMLVPVRPLSLTLPLMACLLQWQLLLLLDFFIFICNSGKNGGDSSREKGGEHKQEADFLTRFNSTVAVEWNLGYHNKL